ncbi:DUF1883 domain-containing protein [Acetobacterium bakii]|uniref:DUF1883 domain-containing protein n=1 Tax=Acetobacterium bakii TaxID=52689 RepID=A0A0L6TZF8_9FIRM|nr:DUF1883 domain-containing protein [Acetobacterium bakii]KNZ41457.1 hypothetical protein AKG39_11855 [Acetobacterium bakii]
MPSIPYVDISDNRSVTAVVELSKASDVMFLDQNNYNKYKAGRDCKYHGGHYTQSPVRITVSGIGRWFLVVVGSGQYKYSFQ